MCIRDRSILGGPGEARQGYSTTQESDTTLLPMTEWTTNHLWDGISAYIWHTWYVPALSWHTRTNAKNHICFLFFHFMLVYLPGLGISEIRDWFFRGPIWMRLKNSGSFCVGQVPGTSHVTTRPKKQTCERRICPSLSRPFAAGPSSSLFVVVRSVLDVILVRSVLDVIRIPGTTVVASPVFSPYFLLFFVCWFFKKKYQVPGTRANNIVCCCLQYVTKKKNVLFRVSLAKQSVCTRSTL